MTASSSQKPSHARALYKQRLNRERLCFLLRMQRILEPPMVFLSFVWLALLVVDLVQGTNPFLSQVNIAIWVIFVIDYGLKFILAPHKLEYVRNNWLTAVALVVPGLRVFRLARAFRALRLARAARGLNLFRVLSAMNRGMHALGRVLKRRGFAYVVLLTLLVTLGGAAGIYTFEHDHVTAGAPQSFGAALWWTAMVMTTMGSDYWPRSWEGRVLCLFLAVYAFSVFGYVTATLASYFVGRDTAQSDRNGQNAEDVAALREQVATLQQSLQTILAHTLQSQRHEASTEKP